MVVEAKSVRNPLYRKRPLVIYIFAAPPCPLSEAKQAGLPAVVYACAAVGRNNCDYGFY